jgi:hypothetical protein
MPAKTKVARKAMPMSRPTPGLRKASANNCQRLARGNSECANRTDLGRDSRSSAAVRIIARVDNPAATNAGVR